ncbi:MAG: TraR/DksA family transcriptional regulator [Acidimicrobiales bacterium]
MPRSTKAVDAIKATAKKAAPAVDKAEAKATDAAADKAAAPRKAPAAKPAEKAAPAKAAAAAKPPTDKFFQEQLALLKEERATYEEQAAALKAQADQMALEMEPGDIQFDDESGEGGTANIDRERDLALSAQARLAVDEIDHAMVKIANGTYGRCEGCGQPIPKARLKALPAARLCVACKSGGLSRR